MMTVWDARPVMTVTLGFPLHLSMAPLPSDTRAGHAPWGVPPVNVVNLFCPL
jgi:hypothetical protein